MTQGIAASQPSGLIVVRQPGISSVEIRTVLHAAMFLDVPVLTGIGPHADKLTDGVAVPVGSVEFVREAMAVLGINEPENFSYPQALAPFLCRELRRQPAGEVVGTRFVKPVSTKAFTGFVTNGRIGPAHENDHDREQFAAFAALPEHAEVWVSDPVSWVSEVRYYVVDGQVVGSGRYDDGPDDSPLPDDAVVRKMVAAMTDEMRISGYSVDVGVLASGETALVECNDGWALGYYRGSVSPKEYLRLLATRWKQLVGANVKGNADDCEYEACDWTPDDPDACPYCSGRACAKCGPYYFGRPECNCDSLERHERRRACATTETFLPDDMEKGT